MSSRAYEESHVAAVVAWLQAVAARFAVGYRRSRIERRLDGLRNVVRRSRTVRWLTAEPDPDVVVVDLTETWTVGPIVRVLDSLRPHVVRSWRGSTVRRLVRKGASEFRAAPVQVVSALVLVALVGRVASTWASAGDTALATACFLAAFALVGLRVTWTWDELVASPIGRLGAALLVPPEPPDHETD